MWLPTVSPASQIDGVSGRQGEVRGVPALLLPSIGTALFGWLDRGLFLIVSHHCYGMQSCVGREGVMTSSFGASATIAAGRASYYLLGTARDLCFGNKLNGFFTFLHTSYVLSYTFSRNRRLSLKSNSKSLPTYVYPFPFQSPTYPTPRVNFSPRLTYLSSLPSAALSLPTCSTTLIINRPPSSPARPPSYPDSSPATSSSISNPSCSASNSPNLHIFSTKSSPIRPPTTSPLNLPRPLPPPSSNLTFTASC